MTENFSHVVGNTFIHTVVSGDSFWEISQKYGCDFTELKELNPSFGPNFNLIHVGDKIIVPKSQDTKLESNDNSQEPTSNDNSQSVKSEKETNFNTFIHTVVSGDSFWEISQKYGCDFTELKKLNPSFGPNFNLIHVGDKIIVPKSQDTKLESNDNSQGLTSNDNSQEPTSIESLSQQFGTNEITAQRNKIIGFYPYWGNMTPDKIRFKDVSHIIYAFLLIKSDGSINEDSSLSRLDSVISLAHSNGVKVMISVGGENSEKNFQVATSSPTKIEAFVNNLKQFVVSKKLDGIDIDWEFPKETDSKQVTAFMRALYTVFEPLNLIITYDLPASNWYGKWVPNEIFSCVTWFNIMAYDFTGSWNKPSEYGPHSSYKDSINSLIYWSSKRGIPRNKLLLGVPFYGKNFANKATAMTYETICNTYPSLDPSLDQVNQIYFNGIETMKKKSSYVSSEGYGGVMIWELSQDHPSKSLLTAIRSIIDPK